MNVALTTILALAAAGAIYTDVTKRRISNKLTFGAAAAALIVRAGFGGPQTLLMGAEGWAWGVGLFLIPFVLGWMGAGDVKLLAAFGAIGGPEFVMETAVLGCVAGGLLAVGCLIREGKLWFTLRYLIILMRHPFGTFTETKRRMPFGPALAAGAGASLVLYRALV